MSSCAVKTVTIDVCKPIIQKPAAPTNLTIKALSTTSLELRWRDNAASFQIVAGFASRYAHIFERSFGFLKSLWVLFAITIIGIFLLGNVVGVFSFVFIYLQQIVRGVRPVIVGDFIHKNISSRYRTTVLSLQSFLTKIVYVPFMLYMSGLTDRFNLTMSINVMGITATIFMFITVVGSILSKKRRAKGVQDARG